MVRETSQWEREEMEKVVSETENPRPSDQQIQQLAEREEVHVFRSIVAQKQNRPTQVGVELLETGLWNDLISGE